MSALLLALLVPGGPIENRDFSYIYVPIIIGFNLFLTVLVFSSFVLGLQGLLKPTSPVITLWAGVCYLLVYSLDLLRIFPVSPAPMSLALWTVEMTGLMLASILIILSIYIGMKGEKKQSYEPIAVPWKALVPIGMVVIVYATMNTIG